jgi:hypothetical protein
MTYENKSGLNVNNQYGTRRTGGAVGIEQGENSIWEMSVQLTPEFINGTFIPPVVVPKGALFKRAFLRVEEVFTLTGTTPTVIIGALGSEATNGIVLTAAELGTVASLTPASTGTGTWSQASTTGTTAAAKVGKALGGTTPAVTGTAGRATLMLEFWNKTKG